MSTIGVPSSLFFCVCEVFHRQDTTLARVKSQGSGAPYNDRAKSVQQKIEQIKTNDLVFYARNARTHDDVQVSQIAGSIQEFGFCNPVLIDATNGIIAGHGRVMAAQLLKLELVPCLRLSHLTDSQKRAYVLADNRIALNSGWNEDLLKEELERLSQESFDITSLGFDESELLSVLGMAEEPELKPIAIMAPPKMTWVLIGIPTVEFGEINEAVERIASMTSVICETTVNDG